MQNKSVYSPCTIFLISIISFQIWSKSVVLILYGAAKNHVQGNWYESAGFYFLPIYISMTIALGLKLYFTTSIFPLG